MSWRNNTEFSSMISPECVILPVEIMTVAAMPWQLVLIGLRRAKEVSDKNFIFDTDYSREKIYQMPAQ